MICCVNLENIIQENGFWHNKFSRPDCRHLYYVAHDTLYLSNLIYLNFIFGFCDI